MATSLTATDLKPVEQIPLASANVDSTTYTQATQQALADITNQQTIAQQNVDTLNKQGKTESSSLASLQSLLGGQATDTAKTYKDTGVTALYNQLADINAQAAGLSNEALAVPIQVQEANKNTGATDRGVAPQSAGALRLNALKALSLGQQAAIASSQYDKAKNYADQIITAKYAQITADIEAKKTNLQALKDFSLTPSEEKLRQVALQKTAKEEALLNEKKDQETRAYNEKIDTQKGIQSVMQAVAEYGGSKEMLSKIQGSQSVEEAIASAGKALMDPRLGLDIETAQVKLKQMKQDLYYSDLKAKAELAPENTETTELTGDISSVLANNKIGQTTKTQIGTILGVLNAAETMAKNSDNGKFKGVSPFNRVMDMQIPFTDVGLPFRETLRSQEGVENVGYINGINLKIQQWASGAALTEEQTKQVARMTPTVSDTDKNVRVKLNNLSNFMQQQIKGSLQAEGVEYEPATVDLFNQSLDEIFQ